MLLKQEKKLTLDPPMHRIHSVSTAYNDTVVILRRDKATEEETIVHLDSSGKILWEKKYGFSLNFFGMMRENEVIVLNVPQHKIDIINLQTKMVIQVNHHFLYDDTAYMSIETFAETNTFCVVEKGALYDHFLRLTYFNYNGICEKSEPIKQWGSSENEWTYDHQTCKMNNHSKIGWWMYHHSNVIQFFYFDLREDSKGEMNTVSVINTIGQPYGLEKIQLDIANMWEMQPNRYMLMGLSTKIQHPNLCKNSKGVINNNFIIDVSGQKEGDSIEETEFFFEKSPDGYDYNHHLIDCYGLGSFSVFPTFRNSLGETKESPIFYVHNETQRIVAQDEWKCSCYSDNYFFPGWDGASMVQTEHTNTDCQEVKIITRKLLDLKEVSLCFLLHINEDFDDDLLLDAVKLLDDSYNDK